MSKYTTELRFICESSAGLYNSTGYVGVDEVITKAIPKIFNFPFPMFDENYREVLERKILKHFYTREICEETVSLWKLRLDTKLNEIMPYYNQLYKSELLNINPLLTSDITLTHDEKSKQNTKFDETRTEDFNRKADGNKKTTDLAYQLYSDTPQGSLNGVNSEQYLTNATKNTDANELGYNDSIKDNTKSALGNTGSNDGTLNYLEKHTGYSGTSASELLLKYRKTFLNIDMQIMNDLEELFFGLW